MSICPAITRVFIGPHENITLLYQLVYITYGMLHV